MSEQLALFNLNSVESVRPVHDPYSKVESTGNPVHDPYWDSLDKEESAIFDQSSGHTDHLPCGSAPPHCRVGEQIFYPGAAQDASVGAQVFSPEAAETQYSSVGAQVTLDTQKIAPQHEKVVHWVEKYWVERSGNKYWYYRYRWMTGRKSHRVYLGSVSSRLAQGKVELVREALSAGLSPSEIQEIISASKQQ